LQKQNNKILKNLQRFQWCFGYPSWVFKEYLYILFLVPVEDWPKHLPKF